MTPLLGAALCFIVLAGGIMLVYQWLFDPDFREQDDD